MNKFSKVSFYALSLMLMITPAVSLAKTNIIYQDKGEKNFTLVQKFVLHQQKYEDVLIDQFVTEARDINNGVDRQVIRFLSAIVNDDMGWWKSTWSAATLDDWREKVALNKDRRLYNYWKARVNRQTKIQLVDFVVFKTTVLIGFNLTNQQNKEYHLLAMALEDNRWRVDQAFMETGLYSHIKQRIE